MKLILSILLSLLSLNLFAADGGLGTVSGTTTVGTIPAGNLPALGVAYPNALTNNSTVAWTNTDNITALTFSGAGSGQGILSLSNAAATGLTVILGPSNAFANVMWVSNTIHAPNMDTPTNTPTDAFVLTATGTGGATAWKAGGSGGGGTNAAPITLSYDGTIVTNVLVDASTPVGCATNALLPYRLTMTTNALIKNPTGMLDGQRITIEFIQDATGSRLAFFDTAFAFGTDITGVTLTTTASKRDFATFIYSNSKWNCVGFVRGY